VRGLDAARLSPAEVESYARSDRYCIVVDATWRLPVPCLPRRRAVWGPTIHAEGVVRTCVRGPHVALALDLGGEILTVHGALICRREVWTMAIQQWRRWLHHLPPSAVRDAVKATYQRVWGRLTRRPGLAGQVETGPVPADGYRRSQHVDDEGAVHRVRWEPDDAECVPYRPDIAGEIVAYTAAETWRMAHRVGLERVALLHVDAVAYVGHRQALPHGWTIKAHGTGSVYGHGRYKIGDAVGRMGLKDGEPLTWARPDSESETRYSVRDWQGWQSWPMREEGDMQTARSGGWPW